MATRERTFEGAGTGVGAIAPGVFCIGPHGRTQTNVYLVRDGGTWVLVDAGWAGDAARIEAAVGAILGADTVPAAILVTHVHPDHAGAARALAESWGCPILLHPAEIPIAEGDFSAMERSAGPLDRWVILPLMRAIGRRRLEATLAAGSLGSRIRPLGPDGAIPGLDGWSWVATAGHTPGHVSYFRPADRVALTGDALVTLRVNSLCGFVLGCQGLSGPPWYTTWDRRSAAASIRAIASLGPTVVGGGHGAPLTVPGTAAGVRAFAARTREPRR